MTPYVSFVTWGRNDSYTPEYTQRASRAVSFLAKQLEAAKLDSEIVFVEWNPVAGKGMLMDELGVPSSLRHVSIRGIVVDARYHARYLGSNERGIHSGEASNVGIRRARGRFVTPKASDTVFSDQVIERIARRDLDPETMYRVNRYDISDPSVFATPDSKLLDALASAESVCNDYIKQSRHWKIRDLHTNACGDFTLMARERWHQIRGHWRDETVLSLDLDSLAMHAAAAFGVKECRWPTDCRVYKPLHNATNSQRIRQVWRPWQHSLERSLVAIGIPSVAHQARMAFDYPRRRVRGVESVVGPSIEKNFVHVATRWATGETPVLSQPENWGLADEPLEIRTICSSEWETVTG